jgi:hypothetical protein
MESRKIVTWRQILWPFCCKIKIAVALARGL